MNAVILRCLTQSYTLAGTRGEWLLFPFPSLSSSYPNGCLSPFIPPLCLPPALPPSGVTHPQAVPSGTLAYSSSRKHRPRSELGAELSEQKPCLHALGGASGPDGAVDWWGRALPRGSGPGGLARAGSAARAAGGGRRGVEPGGVWRSCGGTSRSPHAGRGSPKVSMGRGPCATWVRWRHPAGARLRQVWFGRTGPGATSARSRSAGRWLAAAWREYPEWGRPGRALVLQHLFTSLVPGSTPSPRTTQISRDLRYSRDFVFFKIHFWFVVQDWRRNSVVNLRCGFILTSCYYSDCRKSATGNGTVI